VRSLLGIVLFMLCIACKYILHSIAVVKPDTDS